MKSNVIRSKAKPSGLKSVRFWRRSLRPAWLCLPWLLTDISTLDDFLRHYETFGEPDGTAPFEAHIDLPGPEHE